MNKILNYTCAILALITISLAIWFQVVRMERKDLQRDLRELQIQKGVK